MAPMDALLLADLVGALHALFVLFVVGGQVLILAGWAVGWGYTRNFLFRVLHLAAIGFVVLEAWFGILCPLTVIESGLRRQGGGAGPGGSFIGYWLDRLLYYQAPEWVFEAVYGVFGALVVATFVLYPPRRR